MVGFFIFGGSVCVFFIGFGGWFIYLGVRVFGVWGLLCVGGLGV